MKITIWNEYVHERFVDSVMKIYPEGMHVYIARVLEAAGHEVTCITIDNRPDFGLTDELLANTDVLFWWAHCSHGEIPDEVVDRVYRRVLDGMGMVVLHSGHASKIFQNLMGTSSIDLKWRESDDKEILWVVDQGHPIAEGIDEKIILE